MLSSLRRIHTAPSLTVTLFTHTIIKRTVFTYFTAAIREFGPFLVRDNSLFGQR